MLEFDKFLNANLGKLNKYEEEVKKELFKNNNNNEDDLRSKSPYLGPITRNDKMSRIKNKPMPQRNISQNKLDISKDQIKVRSNISNPKLQTKNEIKNKDVNNIKSIKKEEPNVRKTNKTNNVKSSYKKDVAKLYTIEKQRPPRLELSSLKKNNEVIKKEREELMKTDMKISNKITFLDDLQSSKRNVLNYHSCEDNYESSSKISNNYVSKLLTDISLKIHSQEQEIHNQNNKLSIIENKSLSENYLNGVLSSIIHKFRDETKLLNEIGIDDNVLKKSTLNYVGNLFGDINLNIKKSEEIESTFKDISPTLNSQNTLNNVINKAQHQTDRKNISKKKSSQKSSNSNLNTGSRRKSQEYNNSSYLKENKQLLKKNTSSIVQHNIIINNTFIGNSPTIVLNFKKSISHKDTHINNDHSINTEVINHRKSIKNEKTPYLVNELKKTNLQQPHNSSNVNNNETDENKECQVPFKRNSLRINNLVERNEKKNNEIKDCKDHIKENKSRDLSSDTNVSNKTMERLNKSRCKFKESSVPKIKTSEEFNNKIESLSKMFVQNNRLSLSSEPCKQNIQKEEDDSSYIKTTLNRPMRIKAINKKTKQNFN